VAQHVRVDRKFDAGLAPGTADDLAHGIGRQRRFALADEDVSCARILAPQSAENA
jgi:hypothetical protein